MGIRARNTRMLALASAAGVLGLLAWLLLGRGRWTEAEFPEHSRPAPSARDDPRRATPASPTREESGGRPAGPDTGTDEERPLARLTYSGVALSERGYPEEGVTLHLLVGGEEVGASNRTGPDGAFSIPIPSHAPLHALFVEDADLWGKPVTLEPRAAGRLFVPSPASRDGLTGQHRVVLRERPVGIRLRFRDGATDLPLAGASVSLFDFLDAFALGPPAPVDTGTTDGEGIYAPRWPLALEWASLRLTAPDGRVAWTYLRRADAEGTMPRDLLLPPAPLTLRAICVRGDGEEPVAGAFVALTARAGIVPWGRSDAAGGVSWAFLSSDSFDPEPLRVNGWAAAWRDGTAGLRVDAGGAQAGADLAYGIGAAKPLRLRLGAREAPGLWIRTTGARTGPDARPIRVTVCLPGTEATRARPRAVLAPVYGPADPDGPGALWWARGYEPSEEAFGGRPPETLLSCQVDTRAEFPALAETTLGAVAAARESRNAVTVDLAPTEGQTRTVTVRDRKANPRAGALVAVIIEDPRFPGTRRETERAVTDARGRAVVHSLALGGDCRILVWDPADGASGLVRELPEDGAGGGVPVTLDPARDLQVRLRMADGTEPLRADVTLVPWSSLLPPRSVHLRAGEAPVAQVFAVPVHAYTVVVTAFDTANRPHHGTAPASEVADGEIVLGGSEAREGNR